MKTITIAVLLLAGCASPYHKYSGASGYTDTIIRPNTYEVRYTGDEQNSATQTRYYATVRAAEVCVENGHQFFEITESHDETTTATRALPPGPTPPGWRETQLKPDTEPAPRPELYLDIPVTSLVIRLLASRTPHARDAIELLRGAQRQKVPISAGAAARLSSHP